MEVHDVTLDEAFIAKNLDIIVYIHEGDLCIYQNSGIVIIPPEFVGRFSNAILSCCLRAANKNRLN